MSSIKLVFYNHRIPHSSTDCCFPQTPDPQTFRTVACHSMSPPGKIDNEEEQYEEFELPVEDGDPVTNSDGGLPNSEPILESASSSENKAKPLHMMKDTAGTPDDGMSSEQIRRNAEQQSVSDFSYTGVVVHPVETLSPPPSIAVTTTTFAETLSLSTGETGTSHLALPQRWEGGGMNPRPPRLGR